MAEEEIINTEEEFNAFDAVSNFSRKTSFIDKATSVDEQHVPPFIIKNFWAYYNELALTANLKQSDIRSFKYTAEIITYMQAMQFSRDELETDYDYTSFLQAADSIYANLSRTVDGLVYEAANKIINEQVMTERTEKLEKEKKGVSLI